MIALLTSFLFQHVDNDIVYSTVGTKKLTLDAYRPLQPNKMVFVVFHGGDFYQGSKGAETGELCRYLAKRGFVCFDVNYRLQKDVGGNESKVLSAAVDDAVNAYHWAQKNASAYGGDPQRIGIGGMSAGAAVAMTAAYSKSLGARSVIDLWGGLFGKQTDIKKGDPPMLIVHGLNDPKISIGMARAIENRALQVKVQVRFLMHQGKHGIDLNQTINRYTILEHIDSFLRETMK
jgi:dienelactone hydrolase